jgi:O-antigen/teichoic acid export membrane protein
MDFGVRESVVRFVSKYNAKGYKYKSNTVINAAIMMYSIFGAITLIIIVGLAVAFPFIFNISDEDITLSRVLVVITGLTISQTFVFNVFRGVIMALQRYDIFYKISIITQLVRVVLIVTFLSKGYGILSLAIIQFFTSLGSSFVMYLSSKKVMEKNDIYYKLQLISLARFVAYGKKLFNYSFFVLINNLSQKAMFASAAVIIGIFLPAAQVTFFAIAGNLIEYLRKLSRVTSQIFNPLASELEAKNDYERLKVLLIDSSKLSLLTGLPICIVYIIAGADFIGLWMGEEYSKLSGSVLIVLSVSQITSLPHHAISNILYGISKHHITAYLRVFEAIANVTISVILVQSIGIIGVAYGTAIPHILVTTFILPVVISKIIGLNVFEYLYKSYLLPIVAVIPFTLVCNYVNTEYPADNLAKFFINIILTLPIFFVSAWYISFSKEERIKYMKYINTVLRKKSNIKTES